MANKKQLEILKQGVLIWNQWRREHPKARLNLSNATLAGANLNGATLREADLSGADLSGANLSGADLSEALQLHF
jgi:uncharacterized protein YjbI with pentapeptide repeats